MRPALRPAGGSESGQTGLGGDAIRIVMSHRMALNSNPIQNAPFQQCVDAPLSQPKQPFGLLDLSRIQQAALQNVPILVSPQPRRGSDRQSPSLQQSQNRLDHALLAPIIQMGVALVLQPISQHHVVRGIPIRQGPYRHRVTGILLIQQQTGSR